MKNKIYGAISPTEDKQVDVRAAAASLKKNSCDRTILVPKKSVIESVEPRKPRKVIYSQGLMIEESDSEKKEVGSGKREVEVEGDEKREKEQEK